jgi:hypothetical protein
MTRTSSPVVQTMCWCFSSLCCPPAVSLKALLSVSESGGGLCIPFCIPRTCKRGQNSPKGSLVLGRSRRRSPCCPRSSTWDHTRLNFESGAFNHSATLPAVDFQALTALFNTLICPLYLSASDRPISTTYGKEHPLAGTALVQRQAVVLVSESAPSGAKRRQRQLLCQIQNRRQVHLPRVAISSTARGQVKLCHWNCANGQDSVPKRRSWRILSAVGCLVVLH